MRRALFQLLAGLPLVSGDGLRRPVNAPAGYRPGPGVQPGVQQPVVIANRVILQGPQESVLAYSPSAGPGNLVASLATNGFTDSFGNHVLQGFAQYSATDATAYLDGEAVHYTGTQAGGWTPDMQLLIDSSGVTITSAVQQLFQVASAHLLASVPVLASVPGSPTVAESWHAMTLVNGWANTAGFAPAQYRFLPAPANDVEIVGVINSTAATSTTFAILPAGYRPANANGYAVGATANVPAGAAPQVRCDTSGNLTVNGGPAFPSTVSWFINGLISLDA